MPPPPPSSTRCNASALISTRPAQTGRAAPAAPSLPTDIVFDILTWAPVKSLCRLRCVCREWHAIVSDPALLAVHRSHTEPQPLLVCYRKDHGLLLIDLDGNVVRVMMGVGAFSTFCPTLDDLVCVVNTFSGLNLIDLATGMVLLNLNYPDIAGYTFGFGRATPSGTYKVIRLMNHLAANGHNYQTCEVLELGGGTLRWRQTQSPQAPVSSAYRESPFATINGIMYFLAHPGTLTFGQGSVLCFDLESEEWKKMIKCPPEETGKNREIPIAKLNDALCVVHEQEKWTHHASVDIWILIDADKNIWDKAYTIPMAQNAMLVMPVMVTHDDGKLLFYCFFSGQAMPVLQVYDIRTKTSPMF